MPGTLGQLNAGNLDQWDEIITGFRWHNGGAQAYHALKPDLCSFGKGMANGFSVSALCGRRDVMEQGGLRSDRKRVFTLSTTHGDGTNGSSKRRIPTSSGCSARANTARIYSRA